MFSNIFPHLPLKKISMILQMKLADGWLFCCSRLGHGIRQGYLWSKVQSEKPDVQRSRQESWGDI